MKASAEIKQPPDTCPVCGADVPRKALACPGCGADHQSGWDDAAINLDSVDLPDEPFNYEQFVEREFGGKARPAGQKKVWWVVGIVLLIVVGALFFFPW